MTGWDGDAPSAVRSPRRAGTTSTARRRSSPLDPAPTSVLDAGCGTGRAAIELAHCGMTVVGVDVDRSMLDRFAESR